MIILNADGSILVAGKRHTVRFEDIITLASDIVKVN